MLIKIILITTVLVCAYYLTRAQAGDKQLAVRRLLLACFVVAAVISILFPDLTTKLANLVGVGRGADLILYALVIAFLSYAVTLFRRLNRQEIRLTKLARQLALLAADRDPNNQKVFATLCTTSTTSSPASLEAEENSPARDNPATQESQPN